MVVLPCVDVTFGSAAKVYGDKVLSLVLTGMGADGREGARMRIIIQLVYLTWRLIWSHITPR